MKRFRSIRGAPTTCRRSLNAGQMSVLRGILHFYDLADPKWSGYAPPPQVTKIFSLMGLFWGVGIPFPVQTFLNSL
jgi:hypothetical protein